MFDAIYYMEKLFFDDDFVRKTRLVLCPNCDNEFRVDSTEENTTCDECGEFFEIEDEGSYPEEFVWHPSQEF